MDVTIEFIISVVLSVLVGMWNQNRGHLFWKGLILAVLLSLVIAGIVVAVESGIRKHLKGKNWHPEK